MGMPTLSTYSAILPWIKLCMAIVTAPSELICGFAFESLSWVEFNVAIGLC